MSAPDFKETMRNLKAHHSPEAQPRPGASPEQLPGRPLPPGEMQLKNLPQDVQAAVDDYQAAMNAGTDLREQGMTSGVSQYQQTKDEHSFRDEMNELRARDRQRSIQEIDKLYDRLILIGEQDPSAQAEIIKVLIAINGFTDTQLQSFANFINELNSNIRRWGNDAFRKVQDWANGAADSIAKFFSGLA